jgi:acyl-coenzyme A synthetase/AMP-(fatty) acid ligase
MFDRLITYFAKQTPQAIAICTPTISVTYAELESAIDRFAAELTQSNPPKPGLTGVAVSDRYIHRLILLALARLGVTSTSYLSVMREAMEPLLKPDFVITDEAARPDSECGPRLLRITKEWLEAVGRRPHMPMPRPKIAPDGLARVMTSSGTTAMPKKFGMSWQDVEQRVLETAVMAGTSGMNSRVMSLVGPEFLALPALVGPLCRGATVLFGSDDPVTAAKCLTRLEPTAIYMAPVQLKVLLDALPPGFLPLRNLSLVVSGAHTPRSVREEARARLSNDIRLVYGTTECGIVATRRDTATNDDDTDVGTINPWCDVEIVDATHKPMTPGAVGRIRVRGTNVIDRYIDDDEANATYFHDGWFYPGDIGSVAQDGRLRVLGRTDEMMNFGGASFMPHAIEGAVMACAGVVDAGAFSMRDKNGFDMPWIAIVRGPDLREQDVAKALMLPGLPPVRVVWIDKVPRTSTGKVYRDQLQAAAQDLNPK